MADDAQVNDEDVPPLEDMSELMQQLEGVNEYKSFQQQSAVPEKLRLVNDQLEYSTHKQPSNDIPQTKDNQVVENAKSGATAASSKKFQGDGGTFAGMKKGFLFGGSNKKQKEKYSTSTAKSAEVEVPLISPRDPGSKERMYEFPEVQQAINAGQNLLQNKDWVTEDLLTKIMKDPTLSKRLTDPTFMAAILEFQRNPKAAMQRYHNNKDMQQFLQQFCGLMGEHFTKLDGAQPSPGGTSDILTKPPGGADISVRSSTDPKQSTAADEARIQEIMDDPEVRDILMDPQIQRMFEVLRHNPQAAQSTLRQADPSMQKSIRKLVQVGLLQFET